MNVLGLGHASPTHHENLADAVHPNKMQLEAIRRAGYDKYWVNKQSARVIAAEAVLKALQDAQYSATDIGFIVAGQSTVPDFIGIDLACQTGAELGDLEVRTINLVEGCGSAISSWDIANNLINDLKIGQVGVIVLAQRISEPHHDRFGLMNAILSDGAVAAIVSKAGVPSKKGSFVYKGGHDISCTRFVDMMRIERGGGIDPFVLPDHDTREDKLGRDRIMELYRFSGNDLGNFLKMRADNTINTIECAMSKAGWAKEGNYFFLHTLEGRQSIETLAQRLGISVDKTNSDLVSEIGHMGCADSLISLDILRKQDKIQSGSRIIMSTISTGMKWGCYLLEYVEG